MDEGKRVKVLWECSWTPVYEDVPEDFQPGLRSVRVVGWYFQDDQYRLGALHVEELNEDCLGQPTWTMANDWPMGGRALAVLLQQAGHIPDGDDISCVDEVT
jgi:hypothetical protein